MDEEEYLKFLFNIGIGKINVKEYEEWLNSWKKDKESFAEALVNVGKVLLSKHQTLLYPLELIIVPRFPFSKQPLVKWNKFQIEDSTNKEIAKIKEIAGLLGNLINSGFILKNFILMDVDTNLNQYENDFDIKTRRGYHKLFYIPNVLGVEINIEKDENKDFLSKIKLQQNNINIEIMSGPLYLGSHPLQSRYLVIENNKINVLKYKILNKETDYAFKSADLSIIQYKTEEAIEQIKNFLNKIGLEDYAKNLKWKEITKDKIEVIVKESTGKQSRFNENHTFTIGGLNYYELKELLQKNNNSLPSCIKKALFEPIKEGEVYRIGRLLAATIPFLVFLNKENLESLAKDFAERSGFKNAKLYYWNYFTGKIKIEETEVNNPSKLGVAKECWEIFKQTNLCETCPLRDSCLKLNEGSKRSFIVDYLTNIIEKTIGEEN